MARIVCARIAIMDLGRLIAVDTPANFIEKTPNARDLDDVFLALTGRHLRD